MQTLLSLLICFFFLQMWVYHGVQCKERISAHFYFYRLTNITYSWFAEEATASMVDVKGFCFLLLLYLQFSASCFFFFTEYLVYLLCLFSREAYIPSFIFLFDGVRMMLSQEYPFTTFLFSFPRSADGTEALLSLLQSLF